MSDYLLMILAIFGSIIGGFVGSYFKKLGENWAILESLREMTEKVESIKIIYSKDLETVKHQLDYLKSNKLSYNEAKREALLKVHSNLYYLIQCSTGDFKTISSKLKEQIEETINENKHNYQQFILAESNVILFLNNDVYFGLLLNIKAQLSKIFSEQEALKFLSDDSFAFLKHFKDYKILSMEAIQSIEKIMIDYNKISKELIEETYN